MRKIALSLLLLTALALPARAAPTIVQCKTTGGAQGPCANASIQTAKLVDGANFVTLTGSQILTNKTLNCANNTCTVRLGSDVTGITPIANGGTASATGDLVATNFLGTPWLKLSSIASPGTPASGATWIYSTTANGQDQLYLNTSDGITTALGSGSAIVRNTSGSTITIGKTVYVTGSTGNIPNVALARSNAVATTAAYGFMITASCANNAYCRVMRSGVLSGVDTSAFTAGDILWVSSSSAGGVQNTDPVWPAYSAHVGYVLVSGVGNGSIAVTAEASYTGNETGTTNASWTIGTGAGSGAVTTRFANAFTGVLSWTPTASRTLTLPDTTDTLVGQATPDTLTNKTLTSPTISGPTFSGTEGGTRTIGGTPTLGVNLAAGGFKVTGLGAPSAASSDAATAIYAEAQKTGSVVVLGTTSQTLGTWTANYYIGPYGIVEGALLGLTSTPVPACFSVAGTLKNFSLQAQVTNSPATNITVYKTAAGAVSYSATSAVIPVANNAQIGSDTTHSLAITAGDCVIERTDTSWVQSGVIITAQFVPTT